MRYIYVLGFTLLLQQSQGSWLENLERITSPLLEPINNLNDEIQSSLAELQVKQEELGKHKLHLSDMLKSTPKQCITENLLSHVEFHSQWDLEGCLNLTGDWKDGVLFAMKFAIDSMNITSEVWKTVSTAMNCSESSVFNVLPCYYKTITSLKDEISNLRDKMAPLIAEGNVILLNMRKDLKYCLGIPETLQYRIEKNIGNCVKNYSRKLLDLNRSSNEELV